MFCHQCFNAIRYAPRILNLVVVFDSFSKTFLITWLPNCKTLNESYVRLRVRK